MFSVRLLPSTACIVQYLKCSSTSGKPLTQQFCFIKTENFVESKVAERGSLIRRNAGERASIIDRRKIRERGGFLERKSVDGRNSLVEKKSFAGGRNRSKKEKQELPPFVKSNRGVGHTLAAIAEESGSNYIDDADHSGDLEFSEDFADERDFFNAAEDFDEVQREEFNRRQKLAYQITKRKFFKPPVEPNLLTYAEKEHIRFLHEDEHQKWSIESLAESYPATPEIIQQIIKRKWKPKSAKDILRHDKSVVKNWEAFKKGELKISSEALKKHLTRFLDRSIKIPSIAEAEKYVTKPEKKPFRVNEFSEIIKKYQTLDAPNIKEGTTLIGKSIIEDEQEGTDRSKSRDEYQSKQSRPESKNESEARLILETMSTNRRAKHFTLDKFKKTLEMDSRWEKEIDSVDQQIISSIKRSKSRDFDVNDSAKEIPDNGEISLSLSTSNRNESKNVSAKTKNHETLDDVSLVKSEDNKLVTKSYDMDLAEELKIAEYVKIPKHLKKEGCLYKVKDCFYAHDGQFLYRVPGLKS